MSRISRVFKQGPVFAGYLTAGQGGMEYTVEAASALLAGGVDLLELGLPYSDPVADGPVIQQASTEALARGTTPSQVLELARRVRDSSDAPIVLMSYYNPLLRGGVEFLHAAKAAGVDGILVVDLPIEEAGAHLEQMRHAALEPIFIVTPSTPDARVGEISRQSSGFLYYACRKGTTGVKSGLPDHFGTDVARVKRHSTLPLLAGFGLSDRNSAKQALEEAHGFVVGSAFVKAIAAGATPIQLKQLAEEIDPRQKRR